jgi:hypothetical protein
MQMHYRRKTKVASMLALLMFVAATTPAWSAGETQSDTAVAGDSTAESATSAPEQATPEQTTPEQESQEQAVAPAAKTSEPPSGDLTAEPQSGSEQDSDTDKVEVLEESFSPANWLVYKPLWAVTSLIGDFNPIGKYISAPLEEKFPGLRVKGFINSITQINTTSTNHSVGLGGRDKDWRLQKQEIRSQLELKYQANPNIELVSITNFQYDGAYDIGHSDGLYRDGSSNQVMYSQGKRIFKEMYVRGNYGKLNFTLGKQIVNWGKFDGKIIDIVNAEDGRDVVQYHMSDYEWRYIGQWMANVSYRPVETLTLNLLVNPDFQPNQGPAQGSPYWYPWVASSKNHSTIKEKTPKGYEDVRNLEMGFRADATLGALTLSGIYYYGFDRDAVYAPNKNALIHPIEHKFGYAADYATNILGQRLVIRSEGLYTRGKTYYVPSAKDGLLEKDQLKIGLALETSLFSDENKVDVLYQPIWTQQIDYDARTGVNRNEVIHVVNLSHSVRKTNDRLTLSATGYLPSYSSYAGYKYNVSAGWKFNDYLKATLAYNDYWGGKRAFPFGAYEKWKNVELNVKYEF